MTEKRCAICDEEDKVKLIHALDGKDLILACEKCVANEGLIVVKRPTDEQLEYANKPYTVKERLAKAMNTNKNKPVIEPKPVVTGPRMYCLSPYHKVDLPIKLVDNFNWEIMKARKAKKLTQNQVAQAINEPIELIKVLESGCINPESERVLRKLEQYFRITLMPLSPDVPRPGQQENKIAIGKDNVKTLTVGDLIRVQKERQRRVEEAKNNPKKEEAEEDTEAENNNLVGDGVEIEE